MQTVLVVDDSKSARFALRRELESRGYRVDTADGAQDAYAYLRSNRPLVVFLDHIMPGIDGLQALEHLKADPATATLPVVICSSNDESAFLDEARAKGACAMLQKPPQPDHLSRILDELNAAAHAPAPAVARPSVVVPLAAVPKAPMLQGDASTPVPTPPAAPTSAETAPTTALREQTEARMKKLAQDVFMQIAEIRGTLTHLESRAEAAAATDDALQQLRARLAQLEASMETRLGEIAERVRATVAQEAQAVAERTMTAVAARISNQLADTIMAQVAESILKSLGQKDDQLRGARRANET